TNFSQETSGISEYRTGEGTRSPGIAQQDSESGSGRSRQESARILFAGTAARHSTRVGGERRFAARYRRASQTDRSFGDAGGSAQGSGQGTGPADPDESCRCRVYGEPH